MTSEEQQDHCAKGGATDVTGDSSAENGEPIVTDPEYRAVVKTIDDAVFVFDVEHDGDESSFAFRHNNPAHAEITGITAEEFGGASPEEIVGEEAGAEVAARYRRCVDAEETIEYEETLEHQTEAVEWHTKLTPLFEDGTVRRIVGVARDITEQKEQERELRRFEAFISNSPTLFSLLSADGTVLFDSTGIEVDWRHPPEAFFGEDIFEFIHPDDRETVRLEFGALVDRPGDLHEFEFRFRTQDDQWRWLRSFAVNYLEDPIIDGIIVNSLDITEEKARELELQRQKAFTDQLLDALEDVVYVLDTSGNLEQWNAALEAVTGYHHDEIDSMNAVDFFAEEDAQAAKAAVEATFETGRTRIQLDFLTADGESIPYEFIAHAFKNPSGEDVMAGIGRDRTIHVEFEERLEEERDFFERTIESLPYPFYVLNVDDYTIELANSLANVSEGETCYEITHDREQPCDAGERAIACPLSDVSTKGEPVSVEHTHYREDGTQRVYQVHAAPIFDADGNVVQLAESNIDITDRVRYEQQLAEQRDNLKILNQVVRHDIRNDMTVVKGRAQLIEEELDGEHQEHIEALLEATEEAIELTRTARDLSETMLSVEAALEPVSLERHLSPSIENARAKYDNAVITIGDRIPDVTIQGDELLEAVFRNLIQNAVVHNDKPIPNVQLSTTLNDGTVRVTIADNGPGIPDDQKETIFGKGEKGLDSPGTGIGLYLVRTLVERYGGDVWVEDNDPEGAVFVVQLPVAE